MLIFDEMSKIVSVLEDGGIIIYPGDTGWSMGCDAKNEDAIEKIYSIRGTEMESPAIILVSGIEMLKQYAREIHPRIESLLFYHEKPLTVIYKNVPGFYSGMYGEKKSLAIRVVRDKYCEAFIDALGRPVLCTSVKNEGESTPVHFQHINPELINQVDFVSNYRRNDMTNPKESALVSFNSNGKLKFLK